MATGDETQAGPPPSLPPRRPPGTGGQNQPSTGFGFDYGSTEPDSGYPQTGTGIDAGRNQPPRPQILAPQANQWATDMEEVEVVKGRLTGLLLLFLLALLLVAVIALGLAAVSVLRGGDDVATDDGENTTDPTSVAETSSTTETSVSTTGRSRVTAAVMLRPRKNSATCGMKRTSCPRQWLISDSCTWPVSRYGTRLPASRSGSFRGDGVRPAPLYPDTPNSAGGAASHWRSGHSASMEAVA